MMHDLQQTHNKTTAALLLLLIFAVTAQSYATHYVDWTPNTLAAINNMLTVNIQNYVILGCNNTHSNVMYTANQTAYNICDQSQFSMTIGVCQVGHTNISLPIFSGIPTGVQYQAGGIYYFASTHGNDCINGQKITLNVLETPASTIVTSTATMAATSATATMSVSTSAMNGVASNTMGATTAINNMGITTTVSTTIGADASTSTISSVEISVSPTLGGVGDTDSQTFLDQLPFKGYLVFPLVAMVIIILLCVLMTMCICICCRNKHRKVEILVNSNSSEKGISMKGNHYTTNEDPPPPYKETVDSAESSTKISNNSSIKQQQQQQSSEEEKKIPPNNNNNNIKKPNPVSNSINNGHYKSSPNGTRGPVSLRSAPPPPPASNGGPKSLPARTDGTRRQAPPRPPPSAARQPLPPINNRH